MTRRVLVTGGSGFIGTNLVASLLRQPATEVLNYDLAAPRSAAHNSVWIEGDIRDRDLLVSTVREFQPDEVVHLAARTDLRGSSLNDYDANTLGTSNVIDSIVAGDTVQRALFASSRLVCRIGYAPAHDEDYCPSTAYGHSKVETERLVRAAPGLPPWVIVRPTSIWGPFFAEPYKDFFLAIAHGRYIHPRGTPVLKSFGFVGNTVWQLERLLEGLAKPELQLKTLYLCDYDPIEVGAFAALIAARLGVRQPRQLPKVLLRAAAAAGTLVQERGVVADPPLTTFRLNNLLTPMVHETDFLQAMAGPVPHSVSDGIDMTLSHMRAVGDLEPTSP